MNETVSATSMQDPRPIGTEQVVSVIDDLGPLFAGGFMLGGAALVVSAMVDWVAVVSYHTYVDHEIHNWSHGTVVAFGVFAVVVSLVIGRWLFRYAKNLRHDGDPTTAELFRRKRRSFALGSMIPFVLFTPLVWLMVLGFTYSSSAL